MRLHDEEINIGEKKTRRDQNVMNRIHEVFETLSVTGNDYFSSSFDQSIICGCIKALFLWRRKCEDLCLMSSKGAFLTSTMGKITIWKKKKKIFSFDQVWHEAYQCITYDNYERSERQQFAFSLSLGSLWKNIRVIILKRSCLMKFIRCGINNRETRCQKFYLIRTEDDLKDC